MAISTWPSCGAEALDTVRRLKKTGEKPQWSHKDPERKPFPFEAPFHPAEVAHEVFQAYTTFALWDVARRAHLGIAPDEYRRQIGELFAPMTTIAAANPYAWFPVERSADDIVTATPENRMVAYPYTKYSISVMDVDLAGAIVIASHEAADRLGVPADRRVYLHGWCYATDPIYVAEHDPTWASPAMAAASAEALRVAHRGIDDIAYLDLYSCFPSSVSFALDALGLERDDPRGVTVTGGLPFFGGAGSDYLTHSIATMVDVLRNDPGVRPVQRRRHAHDEARVRGVLDRTAVDRAATRRAGRAEEARRAFVEGDPRHAFRSGDHRHVHRAPRS